MISNLLEVSEVYKKYDKSEFELNNVTFSVPSGSIMGFIGENGSGKTTTIKIILGLLRKNSGKIKLFEQESSEDNVTIREDIGVVFDGTNFSDILTPTQLSEIMCGVYKKWDKNKFIELLDIFKLPVNKKFKTFSKGMSTKLSIAVAMSHNAKLLIMDEPTSGLDPIVRDEILDVFLDFVGVEDHSILISSHITSDLEKIADYITFINCGKIILTAKKDDLIYNYGIARLKTEQYQKLNGDDIIAHRKKDYQIDVLISNKKDFEKKYPDYIIDNATLDEIMILMVKGD